MVRVIDRTLVCMETYGLGQSDLRQIAELLFFAGADFLEVSAEAYEALGPAAPSGRYILRVNETGEAGEYELCKDIKRFVCPNRKDESMGVYAEIWINDVRDYSAIANYGDCGRVRIRGLADIILQPVQAALHNLMKAFRGVIELSPDDDCHCATSVAVEWALMGGTDIVTSFFGMDNMAAFEDVTRALSLLKGRKPKCGPAVLNDLSALLSGIIRGGEGL